MADTSRFTPGTFTPNPRRATTGQLIAAQAAIETKLFLRHGEQLLLSMVIPIAILIGMHFVPFIHLDDPLGRSLPMVLAVAVMSAGFTGQAIAVTFDRRYGALKRMGASALPTWTIIVGKICAVAVTVILQTLILGAIAYLLGFHAPAAGIGMGILFLILGTAAFTSLGLLLGGTLGSEVVLALGNLLWFVLMAIAAIVTMEPDMSEAPRAILTLIPSVAMTQGLIDAFHGTANFFAAGVIIAWAAVGTWLATRHFKFTG